MPLTCSLGTHDIMMIEDMVVTILNILKSDYINVSNTGMLIIPFEIMGTI